MKKTVYICDICKSQGEKPEHLLHINMNFTVEMTTSSKVSEVCKKCFSKNWEAWVQEANASLLVNLAGKGLL